MINQDADPDTELLEDVCVQMCRIRNAAGMLLTALKKDGTEALSACAVEIQDIAGLLRELADELEDQAGCSRSRNRGL